MPRVPNIVLLCPDEMKATALGVYGQPLPVSPFIDSLAAHAAVLAQCHTVHPKCVPSRAALVTGQYPHVGGHRTLQLHVRAGEINLLRLLREEGYTTALVGKNHVVEDDLLPDTFDTWIPDGGRQTFEASAARLPRGSYWVGQDPVPLPEWRDYVNTDRALAWIDAQRDQSKPFFLWLNWDSPHPPYKVPAPYYGVIDRAAVPVPAAVDVSRRPAFHRRLTEAYGLDAMSDAGWRELAGTYLDMCRFIDAEVERVFSHLRHHGVLEDTIVVLWSDHGDFAGEHRLVEKWDTAFYDCITRVPLILHAPGRVAPQRSDALIESIDILPTLLELVGIAIPPGVQGRSFLPLLSGTTARHRENVLCEGGQESEMLHHVTPPHARARPCFAYQQKQAALFAEPAINARAKMLRDREWKYVFRLSGMEELYHLQQDAGELNNVALNPEYSAVLAQYRQKLLARLVEAETVLPAQDFLEA